jgi:nicotinamide-nucleotide amidase
LGATSDDITRRAVAETLKLNVLHSEKIRSELEQIMLERKRTPDEQWYLNQSEQIEGAKLLNNSTGLAYGQLIKYGSKTIVLLPGPPSEFNPMLTNELVPLLNAKKNFNLLKYSIAGMTESAVERRCKDLVSGYPQIDFGFCAQPGLVKLSLRIPQNIDHQILVSKIKQLFATEILSHKTLPEEILQLAREKNYSLGTAESCTGGMISAALTAIPGSSDVLHGAVVSYSCDWKNKYLKVKKLTLKKYGAVSEPCAHEMAHGLANKFKLDCGICVTGIAGPGGGSELKPVGLVYISTFVADEIIVQKYKFRGNRDTIRRHTVSHALNQLRIHLSNFPKK